MNVTDGVIHFFNFEEKHLVHVLVCDGQPPLLWTQDILRVGVSPDKLRPSLEGGEIGIGSTKFATVRFVLQRDAEALKNFKDHPEDPADAVATFLGRPS